jgi:hypothetical protein
MVESNVFSKTFRPELFFAFPTLGAGVVYDSFGRTIKRCVIKTAGHWDDTYDSLHFDERYIYDDGVEDVMRWAVDIDEQSGVAAQEISVVGEIRSAMRDHCWRLKFRRKTQAPQGGPTLSYDAKFTQVSPRVVLKNVVISWGLIPLATMQGYHQHMD